MVFIILKWLCLTIGALFLGTNVTRVIYKQTIPAMNFFWMAAGLSGFIILQFCM